MCNTYIFLFVYFLTYIYKDSVKGKTEGHRAGTAQKRDTAILTTQRLGVQFRGETDNKMSETGFMGCMRQTEVCTHHQKEEAAFQPPLRGDHGNTSSTWTYDFQSHQKPNST